jgi:hypothetical protein
VPYENLNTVQVSGQPPTDHSVSSALTGTCAYFKNLDFHLIGHIQKAPAVVGCVAWIAHEKILEALSECVAVSLIVQKEENLRPDFPDAPGHIQKMQQAYSNLRGRFWRYDKTIGYPYMKAVYRRDASIEAVRCAGYGPPSGAGKKTRPNMHHKFLVFCRYDTEQSMGYGGDPYEAVDGITPYGVWTGSFNFTFNGTISFENAVYLTDPEIVKAYFLEWSQIAVISEPLTWQSQTVNPDWA